MATEPAESYLQQSHFAFHRGAMMESSTRPTSGQCPADYDTEFY